MKPREFRHAKHALSDARACETNLRQAAKFDDFDRHWRAWLRATQRIWHKLEGAAHQHPKFGTIQRSHKNLESSDPLLHYIKIARDVEEHSVREVAGHVWTTTVQSAPGSTVVNAKSLSLGGAHFENVMFAGAPGSVAIKISSSKGPIPVSFSGTGMVVSWEGANLLPVDNHRGAKAEPPVEHKGAPIEPRTLLRVIELATTYFDELIAQTERDCKG